MGLLLLCDELMPVPSDTAHLPRLHTYQSDCDGTIYALHGGTTRSLTRWQNWLMGASLAVILLDKSSIELCELSALPPTGVFTGT
jgi:hypothetical protein